MTDLYDKLETINSKQDFVEFVELLRKDLKDHPDEWENKTLDDFLEAVGAWTDDSDGYFQNMHLEIPQQVNWKLFGTILAAAKVYE